jgi:hypothetical protein
LEDETPEFKATADAAKNSGKVQRCAEDNKAVDILRARVNLLERIVGVLAGDNDEARM